VQLLFYWLFWVGKMKLKMQLKWMTNVIDGGGNTPQWPATALAALGWHAASAAMNHTQKASGQIHQTGASPQTSPNGTLEYY
jgi:hypothetical protein